MVCVFLVDVLGAGYTDSNSNNNETDAPTGNRPVQYTIEVYSNSLLYWKIIFVIILYFLVYKCECSFDRHLYITLYLNLVHSFSRPVKYLGEIFAAIIVSRVLINVLGIHCFPANFSCSGCGIIAWLGWHVLLKVSYYLSKRWLNWYKFLGFRFRSLLFGW